MMRLSRALGACVLCLACGRWAAAETIEEVEKKLVEAQGKLKSYTAKTKTTQDLDMSEESKIKSTDEGTIEWMRVGDKTLFRQDSKSMTSGKLGGKEMKEELTQTIINDGQFFYTLSDQGGQKTAYKTKADDSMTNDAKQMFAMMREDHNLKLVGDEKVDGADCYVVELVPKQTEGNPVVKNIMSFRKDCGIAVKTVGKDKNDKVIFTNTTTDIKLNAEIARDRFEFKAPEGVELMDMSKEQP
ncbi:MAG: outer membrane lipoprotein carrier protein LolA [Planctomycetes bacterium]|nr:outer membrane lipoprotein carrier protein LolA [Planctomycetota bacterium]